MDNALRALAEPRRRGILALLRDRELASGEIAGHFPVTAAAISQHLGVLREAGLVVERRVGTRRLYRARPEGLREVREYLDGMWDDGLERLKAHAESEERARRG